jgi:hypothetical protein
MFGFAGTFEPSIAFLGGVRQRILICLLATVIALTDTTWPTWPQISAPNGKHGEYSTVVAVGGTRVSLSCRGAGPATVILAGVSGVPLVIDAPARAQLARSVRLCTVSLVGAVFTSLPNLTEQFPKTLTGLSVPAPYVIICDPSLSPAFNQAPGPPADLVVGMVVIDVSPPPPTGLVMRPDGSAWLLPMDDTDETVLAILSLFWPPDEV